MNNRCGSSCTLHRMSAQYQNGAVVAFQTYTLSFNNECYSKRFQQWTATKYAFQLKTEIESFAYVPVEPFACHGLCWRAEALK